MRRQAVGAAGAVEENSLLGTAPAGSRKERIAGLV
jgi:hypothetical protein